MPWRDALRTVGHDRAGAGIYLFGGYAETPILTRASIAADRKGPLFRTIDNRRKLTAKTR